MIATKDGTAAHENAEPRGLDHLVRERNVVIGAAPMHGGVGTTAMTQELATDEAARGRARDGSRLPSSTTPRHGSKERSRSASRKPRLIWPRSGKLGRKVSPFPVSTTSGLWMSGPRRISNAVLERRSTATGPASGRRIVQIATEIGNGTGVRRRRSAIVARTHAESAIGNAAPQPSEIGALGQSGTAARGGTEAPTRGAIATELTGGTATVLGTPIGTDLEKTVASVVGAGRGHLSGGVPVRGRVTGIVGRIVPGNETIVIESGTVTGRGKEIAAENGTGNGRPDATGVRILDAIVAITAGRGAGAADGAGAHGRTRGRCQVQLPMHPTHSDHGPRSLGCRPMQGVRHVFHLTLRGARVVPRNSRGKEHDCTSTSPRSYWACCFEG
ncbi:hypothetical protein Micbo1qcDRAFT_161174 [Microdochium bolleyi]|uniref:Uncharacterized protein n=1 Tax=Microdochium bolleyi TaxID=196109 RepID=A0A136J7S3_9PEZI|nr:hypothetical protein Micbo1qcDRAFT_161174 [Microdochium bolleyi]